MKTHNEKAMKSRSTVAAWGRSALVFVLALLLASILSAGCSQADGSACNPTLSHDECDNAPTVQCVQPSAPTCYGQAYCCTVDSNGNITDTTDTCQYLIQCQMASAGGGDGGMDATGTD
jgi:hypothetical protein